MGRAARSASASSRPARSGSAATTASADTTSFSLSSPWSHADQQTSPDGTRKFEQWHIAGDTASTVTLVQDSSMSYTDALGAIQKNFSENHVRPAINKDLSCHNLSGHMIEFAVGPDGHRIIINRLLVPLGNGVLTLTYSRSETDKTWDPEVLKSVTSYCGASPV